MGIKSKSSDSETSVMMGRAHARKKFIPESAKRPPILVHKKRTPVLENGTEKSYWKARRLGRVNQEISVLKTILSLGKVCGIPLG